MNKTIFKKNIIRKLSIIFSLFMMFVLALGVPSITAHAEDVSIILALWPTEVQIGETVTATITISGDKLSSYSIFLEYPASILEYQNDPGANGSIVVSGSGDDTRTFNFTAKADGVARIATSGYQIYDENGYQLSVTHAGGSITVGTVEETDDNVKIGNETYTFVNEYQLPTPPQDYELSYVNYKGKDIYAYQSPNHKIKVVCLRNKDYENFWFVYDEETEEFSPFVDYSLDGIKYTIINIPDDVEIPEEFSESNLTLNGSQITAYTDGTNNGLYLLYAIKASGEMGLYIYDTDEGSLTRYDAIQAMIEHYSDYSDTFTEKASVSDASAGTVTDASVEDTTEKTTSAPLIVDKNTEKDEEEEGFLTYDRMKMLLKTLIVLFVIMCVVVIILIIRNGYLTNQLYGDDEEEENEEDEIVSKAKKDAEKTVREEEIAEEKAIEAGEKPKRSKNTSYSVNDDTGEILIEEAEDNNAGVNVPPAEDVGSSKIEEAIKSRPFGMDSAFDVVSADQAPQGDHVYIEPEPNMEGMIDPALYERDTLREEDYFSNEADKAEETAADKKAEVKDTAEKEITEKEITEQEITEQEAAVKEAAEEKFADNKTVDSKTAEKKSADKKTFDKKKSKKNKSQKKTPVEIRGTEKSVEEFAERIEDKEQTQQIVDLSQDEAYKFSEAETVIEKAKKKSKPEKEPDKVVLPGQDDEEDY